MAALASRQRLIAFLSARSHDVAGAEDALADAFEAALSAWAEHGVPDKPEAWLLTVARRRLIDTARHQHIAREAEADLLVLTDTALELAEGEAPFPDERLKLLFVCAHPAIDPAIHTPLMLQTVLGLDAARIASAFIVKPATMGQRLARAKTKIRDAGIPYEVPSVAELPARLTAVLEAIYAAYGTGWDDIAGANDGQHGLSLEALELASLLDRLMPDTPEILGLFALMQFCEARRETRRSPTGDFIPLAEQDTAHWSAERIALARQALDRAGRQARPGRFQLEAAIQSIHVHRIETGTTDWHAICLLYEGLLRLAPTMGARLAQIAALARACSPSAAWPLLEAIPQAACRDHQPYWTLRAHLLQQQGRYSEAREACARAIGLNTDEASRQLLIRQLAALG